MSKELEHLRPLLKYFDVLLDSYPEPISQTELAKRSNVTKSAISKIRNRLLDFCNQRIGLFDRKLVLRADSETFTNLLMLFATDLRFKTFFQSNYATFLLEKANIHQQIAESCKAFSYEDYFSKEDTNMIMQIILFNLYTIKIPEEIRKFIKNRPNNLESFQTMMPLAYLLNEFTSKFDIAIFNSDNELLNLVKLRDKFHAFILDNVDVFLRKWDFVNQQNPQEQATYIRVYKETVRHFVDEYFMNFTKKIQRRAEEKEIDFPEIYRRIGALFQEGNEKNITVMHHKK